MTPTRKIFALGALGVLLLGAGCGGGDSLAFSAETDDPLYQQSLQLKKQGRGSEALAGLLKVIERRGEQPSPESHLDAGLIYLEHIKDPVEAIHHFKKYLDLAPNSTKAALVRQKIDGARRELFRSMPGRPSDDQVGRFAGTGEVDQLRREIEDLRAENARLRGVAPAPYSRTSRGPVTPSDPMPLPSSETVVKVTAMPADFVPATVVPVTPMSETTQATMFGARPQPQAPAQSRPTTTAPRPATTTARPATTPTRPGGTAGKRHTIAAKDTLYSLSKRYGVSPEAIAAVNRDVLPKGVNSTLSPGMELKIP
ncbi:MAG: LysM peptidoglycan-binding domain-containing protein [Verrucomicrobia bacterium]|nr:LysM peptidoglycan-binding domain-containing protein [Verrucomicrobiota bacterium]